MWRIFTDGYLENNRTLHGAMNKIHLEYSGLLSEDRKLSQQHGNYLDTSNQTGLETTSILVHQHLHCLDIRYLAPAFAVLTKQIDQCIINPWHQPINALLSLRKY